MTYCILSAVSVPPAGPIVALFWPSGALKGHKRASQGTIRPNLGHNIPIMSNAVKVIYSLKF